MISRIGLVQITRRLGRRRVLIVAGVLSTASLSILALTSPLPLLLAAMVVYGFAIGIVQPLTMSWMTVVTPVRDRGVAASLRLVGNRVGQTLLPIAAAAASVTGGAALVFGVTASSLLVTIWLSRWAPDNDHSAGSSSDTGSAP
jgi:predicted MFS family arabinose efflux permease